MCELMSQRLQELLGYFRGTSHVQIAHRAARPQANSSLPIFAHSNLSSWTVSLHDYIATSAVQSSVYYTTITEFVSGGEA